MTDDIVTRLRNVIEMNWDGDEVTDPLCEEAADEIERLRAACTEAQLFVQHDKNCGHVTGRAENCTCGYGEMLKKLDL